MLFKDFAIVSDLWAKQTVCKKGKMKLVSGRDYHSLSFRLSGTVSFDIGGKHYISETGGITFMPAHFSYQTQVLSPSTILLVHFRTKKKYPDALPLFLENGDAEIKAILSELCESYRPGGEHTYKCMSLLYTLLERVDRRLRPTPKRLRRAKSHIDKNFAENISIADLAKEAGLSEVHFRNEFKKYFALAPLAYLKKVRIENAKQLLRSGYYTVSDTALACGFESISYFSYEFKRLTGTTPREYIEK